jgi:hypothetical protein
MNVFRDFWLPGFISGLAVAAIVVTVALRLAGKA